MARVPLDIVVRGRQGDARRDVRLYVYDRDTTDEADVYTLESGGSVITQPLESDEEGRYPNAWIAPGSYDLTSPDDETNPTQPWEAISGADIAGVAVKAADETITGAWEFRDEVTVTDPSGNKWLKLSNIAGGSDQAAAVYFYGTNGLGPDGLAWVQAIDVAGDVPFRDLAICKVEEAGTVTDFMYFHHGGASEPARLGIGWVLSPPPAYTVHLSSPDSNPAVGGLGIRVPNTMTASPFALIASATGEEFFSIDKLGRIHLGPENGPVDTAISRVGPNQLGIEAGMTIVSADEDAPRKLTFNINPTNDTDLSLGGRYSAFDSEFFLDVLSEPAGTILLSIARSDGDLTLIGDIEFADSKGPVLKSPDGSDHKIEVDNAGALSTGGVASQPLITAGTSFPGSPVDGDIYIYNADTTNGVKWMFQYRAASGSAYKWEFVGGTPLNAQVVTDQTITGDSTWRDPATAGPSITLPLAGDYDFRWTAQAYNGSASQFAAGLNVAGTDPNSAAKFTSDASTANADVANTVEGEVRLAGLSASNVIKLKYWANAGTLQVRGRGLMVTPVRVSG